ncbi:MAG: hypothetical protein NVSMB32_04500 [Actinomycetota bacterium]
MTRPPHPAGAARPASPATGQLALVGLLLAAATLVSSQISSKALLAVLSLAVAIASLALAAEFHESGLAATPLLYAAGAVLFPVAAELWGEPGLAGASAALVLVVAGRFVLGRPPRGTLLSVSAFILSALFVGFGASYFLLLRHGTRGARTVAGLLVIALLFHAGRWLGDAYLGKRPLAAHLAGTPTLAGVAGGLVGSLAGALGFFLLAHHHLRAASILAVGLAVGAALSISAVGWGLIRPGPVPTDRSRAPGHVLAVLQGVGLAAPAFFYTLRLVLR